jgi:phosphoserine phosphatase
MKTELVPENFRELAEVHFKLSLALEYSEQNEAAIGEVQSAMAMIKKRIELLGLKSKGKEASASENDSTSVEIKELEGFLSDLTSKVLIFSSLDGRH